MTHLPAEEAPLKVPAESTSHDVSVLGSTSRGGLVQAVLLGAVALDSLLYSLVVPFLPGRAHALGASPLITGALFGSYAAGLFAMTLPAGWLANRIGPRRALLLGLVLLMATTLLYAFAPTLAWLFAARSTQGAAAAFTSTSGLALIAQYFDPQQRPIVFGRVFLAEGIGLLLGPPLGGTLYSLAGFRAPFLCASALVMLDGLGRVLVLPGDHQVEMRAEPAPRASWHTGHVVAALLATVGGALVLVLLEPVMPPFLTVHYGMDPFQIGLLFGGLVLLISLVQAAIAPLISWMSAPWFVGAGLLISAGGLALLGHAERLSSTIGALTLVAMGASLILGPTLEMLAAKPPAVTTADEGQTGRTHYGVAYAAYTAAYAAGMLAGPVLSGAVIMVAGAPQGFIWLSLAPLAFIVPFFLLARCRR